MPLAVSAAAFTAPATGLRRAAPGPARATQVQSQGRIRPTGRRARGQERELRTLAALSAKDGRRGGRRKAREALAERPAPPRAQDLWDAHTTILGDPSTALEAGVAGVAVCGTQPADWPAVAALAAEHARVRPHFGVHPWFLNATAEGWEAELRSYLERFPTAGVGEAGLDRARRGIASLAEQRRAFAVHADLAAELRRPLSAHCVRQYGALLEELERSRARVGRLPPAVVVHAWAGPQDLLASFAAANVYFSVGTRELARLPPADLRAIPAERLLIETDDRMENGAYGLLACLTELSRKLGRPVAEVAGETAANAARVYASDELDD